MDSMRRLLAFVRKDFLLETSYRLQFMLTVAGIFISVTTFHFLARLLGPIGAEHLKPYGGDYFAFVLIGIAFGNYLWTSQSTFAASIREQQTMGTLEMLLASPTKPSIIIIGASLWSFLFTSVEVLIYLLFGVLVFGLDMSQANIPATLVILALTILSFSAFGILSAGFIIVFKRGDPISWVFGSASELLGGVLYPITVLPLWLQKASAVLPITYSLRGIRHAVLQGHSIRALSGDILALALFSVVMVPVSVAAFRMAVQIAKKNGTLSQF